MNIFLPFIIKGIGGTATFAIKFKDGMQKASHRVFFEEPTEYDVLFMIVQAPFRYLWSTKRKNKKIVQRLDGTYYWSVASWKFPLFNLKAMLIRHFFTDFTVYQSEYSKYCANKFLGKKYSDISALIYNGVDLNLFSPDGPKKDLRDNPNQQIFFTASAFRREDQIVPLFQALKTYKKKYHSNFKFVIAGTFSGSASHIPRTYKDFKEATFLGKIENVDLPLYERASDIFLFSHLNPPCPNNIIEALACGLPVSGIADGAMPEIITCGFDGELVPINSTGFWKKRSFDNSAFADNIHKIMIQRGLYATHARATAEQRFSLNTMIKKYTDAINQLIIRES